MNKIVKLKAWTVPNYATVEMPERPRQDGIQQAMQYHISELSEGELSGMCDQFRRDVFQKAGKEDPKIK